jgi:hypothetical protein
VAAAAARALRRGGRNRARRDRRRAAAREWAPRAHPSPHSRGNAGEAVRQFELFRRLLHDELGLEPSNQLSALMCGIGDAWVTKRR